MTENTEPDPPPRPRRPGWVRYVLVHGILKYTVPLMVIDYIRHGAVVDRSWLEFSVFLGIGMGHFNWSNLISGSEAEAEKPSAAMRESWALVFFGVLSLIIGTSLLPSMPPKQLPFVGMLISFGMVMSIWGTVKSRSSDYFSAYVVLTLSVIVWTLRHFASV